MMFTTVRMEIGKVYRITTCQDTVFEGPYLGLEWKGAGIGWELLFEEQRFSGNNIGAVEEVK